MYVQFVSVDWLRNCFLAKKSNHMLTLYGPYYTKGSVISQPFLRRGVVRQDARLSFRVGFPLGWSNKNGPKLGLKRDAISWSLLGLRTRA